LQPQRPAFSHAEALNLWSRLVAGWANGLNNEGSAGLFDGIVYPDYDANGSQEAVTRMMWGLGGWLSRPDRSPIVTWRGTSYDVAALTKRALLNGTDPRSPGYWGESPFPGSPDIWMVDAGQIAFCLWQSRHHIWNHLTAAERDQIIAWLEKCGHHPGSFRNNFALFWALNHASRKALVREHDDKLIDDVLDYMDHVYCGDGWYDDAAEPGTNSFDDYNWWVFASHTLCWAQVDGQNRPDRKRNLLDRVRLLMQHYPYFFAADGAYTEFGRSLAYKFGRLGAPIWAYQQGAWPHETGMLRRLVGAHLRWYAEHGAIRADGTLRQELTSEGSPEVRETYISTGSPYWATQAYGALWTLADDDPFWTVPDQPLPVEQGDFVHIMPEPGWILVGSQRTGAVQRFTSKAGKSAAKYGKYHYTTTAPFNAGYVDGYPSPDGMLSLLDRGEVGHRQYTKQSAVGEPGWLRMSYTQTLHGLEHSIETTIVVNGHQHLRIHRVHLAEGAPEISAIEGAAALGYPPGDLPRVGSGENPHRSWAGVNERYGSRYVSIQSISGHSHAEPPAAWRGADHLNSVYGRYVLPALRTERVTNGHILVSLVTIGDLADRDTEGERGREVPTINWNTDDTIVVTWSPGIDVAIPPLPSP